MFATFSPRRLTWTWLSLAGLIAAAVIERTRAGADAAAWAQGLSYVPDAGTFLNVEKLLVAAFHTRGGSALWGSLVLVAVGVGSAEKLSSTWRAFLTFWGVHLGGVLVGTLLAAAGRTGHTLALDTAVRVAWDLGPTSAAFGCLGLATFRLPVHWKWLLYGLSAGAIAVILWRGLPGGKPVSSLLVQNLIPAASFVIGWASSFLGGGGKGRGSKPRG